MTKRSETTPNSGPERQQEARCHVGDTTWWAHEWIGRTCVRCGRTRSIGEPAPPKQEARCEGTRVIHVATFEGQDPVEGAVVPCPGCLDCQVEPAPPSDTVEREARSQSWPCICRPSPRREDANKTIEVVPLQRAEQAEKRAEEAEAERDREAASRERLERALEFYADETTYRQARPTTGPFSIGSRLPIHEDLGAQARAALASEEGEGE
jgi:hypothetical protein